MDNPNLPRLQPPEMKPAKRKSSANAQLIVVAVLAVLALLAASAGLALALANRESVQAGAASATRIALLEQEVELLKTTQAAPSQVADTPAPTPVPATLTPVPATPTPMPTSLPAAVLALEWQATAPLYDLPAITITASSGWVLTQVNGFTGVIEPGNAAPIGIGIAIKDAAGTRTLVSGTFSVTSSTLVTWMPAPAERPVAAGEYAIGPDVAGYAPTTQPLIVAPAPLRVTLKKAEARTLPSSKGALDKQDGKMLDSVKPGAVLEVVGYTEQDGVLFLRFRVAGGSRELFWVPAGPQGKRGKDDAYVQLEDGGQIDLQMLKDKRVPETPAN